MRPKVLKLSWEKFKGKYSSYAQKVTTEYLLHMENQIYTKSRSYRNKQSDHSRH